MAEDETSIHRGKPAAEVELKKVQAGARRGPCPPTDAPRARKPGPRVVIRRSYGGRSSYPQGYGSGVAEVANASMAAHARDGVRHSAPSPGRAGAAVVLRSRAENGRARIKPGSDSNRRGRGRVAVVRRISEPSAGGPARRPRGRRPNRRSPGERRVPWLAKSSKAGPNDGPLAARPGHPGSHVTTRHIVASARLRGVGGFEPHSWQVKTETRGLGNEGLPFGPHPEGEGVGSRTRMTTRATSSRPSAARTIQ